ncbi:hypothetical protein CY0110_19612 [Crocosphaera chwakensis CCY0110]|uniref:Uncharacterized protein n=1 Tax=Crocosphaera chwakensis CCY0110 TaxID=391612 RepID=A3IJQ4_9CHRO|nr:hypothetical protein CY0110_19612 [Crocosphaera chwakensis CCY0110]
MSLISSTFTITPSSDTTADSRN